MRGQPCQITPLRFQKVPKVLDNRPLTRSASSLPQ